MLVLSKRFQEFAVAGSDIAAKEWAQLRINMRAQRRRAEVSAAATMELMDQSDAIGSVPRVPNARGGCGGGGGGSPDSAGRAISPPPPGRC